MAVLFLAVLIGAGAAFLAKGGKLGISALPFLAGNNSSAEPPVVRAPKESLKEPPMTGFANSPEEVDAAFQKAALWKILKAEFPGWYGDRVKDAVRLHNDKKDPKAISTELTAEVVKLRRQHAGSALASSPARLRAVAAAFVGNLERLARHSTAACYGFISGGETDPIIVELAGSPEHTAGLQAQMGAIFEAVADGRKTPRQHPQAQREDFEALATQLSKRGWSPADLQLFSDARALSKAPPERVCKMVQDWFAAQLAVPDEPTQVRLLVETLKPVVAG